MCGRFIIGNQAVIEREFAIMQPHWRFAPSYNVAPTQPVPVVRMQNGQRAGLSMRWGLIPYFAKGEPPKYSTINATVEKLESGSAWRDPWNRGQRCIMPAVGFYEWHMDQGKKNPVLDQTRRPGTVWICRIVGPQLQTKWRSHRKLRAHYPARQRAHAPHP